MYIDLTNKELTLKIVYCGPALSGKTTNLIQIHRSVSPRHRSDLISLQTANDRTMYFDFVQIEVGKVSGLAPKFQIYTVPGQSRYEVSRKIILRGVDGVVFVADSQPHRLEDNCRAWSDLLEHLKSYGKNIATFPIILQWNKCDLPTSSPVAHFKGAIHVNGQYPLIESAVLDGRGVFETLQSIMRATMSTL